MLTFQLTGAGYRIYDGEELRIDQPGDPRLECVEPMVLPPFASLQEAEAHARQAIIDMTPPELEAIL